MEVIRISHQVSFIKDCEDDGCQQLSAQPSKKGPASKAKAKVPAEEVKTSEKRTPSANSKGETRTKQGDGLSPVDAAPMESVGPRTPKVKSTKYKPGELIINVSQDSSK